jgi:putative serine protease PepD
MVWTPTHLVPAGGIAAWNAPDPASPAAVLLPARVELVVETTYGGWAQVRAQNGWSGWVDSRHLVAIQPVVAAPGSLVWAPTPDVAVLDTPDAPLGFAAPDAPLGFAAPDAPPVRAGRDLRLPLAIAVVGLVAVMAGALVFAGILPGGSNPSPSPVAAVASPAPTAGSATVSQTPVAVQPTRQPADPQAASLQELMVAVIKQVGPSVVEIETDSGLGSGVIYDAAGDIVTNAHVVGTATTFKVTLADGHTYTGSLVGRYVPDDIAVIRITAPGLSPATFADSSQLSVGQFVLAMGNPLGLQSSVTEGIISALSRQVSEPAGNALPDVIQTSAAINPGNSGGALVDLNGEVVGIPTLAAVDQQLGGSAPGIGFAISSNRAKAIADQLIATGKVTDSGRAYMGVTVQDSRTDGALVVSVVAGGPAGKAGLVTGDTITAIDDKQVPDSSTLIEVTAGHHPGDIVKLTVLHQGGKTTTISVTLGTLPG